MSIVTKLQYIFLYILSLIIIGATTVLTSEAGLNLLKEPSYYINQLLTDAAILCVTFATLYAYLDYFKLHDKEYLFNEKYVSDFAMSKNNVPSIISRYLEFLNRRRKIKQYEYNVQKALYKLENKRMFIFFGPRIYKEKDLYIWNHGTKEEKAANKYCSKRQMYEDQLDLSNIEKCIDWKVVKYDRITTNIILGGYFKARDNTSPNDFITKNPTAIVLKNKVPGMLFSFTILFILSSIVFDYITLDANAFINLCVKLLVLLWNCYTTLRYAKRFSQDVTLKDSRFRKGLIVEYEKWLAQEAAKISAQEVYEIKLKEDKEDKANESRPTITSSNVASSPI